MKTLEEKILTKSKHMVGKILKESHARYDQAYTEIIGKSVGVMGDERTYDYVINVHVLQKGKPVWIPYKTLNQISDSIVNEVEKVNRVCYDLTGLGT